MGRSKQFMLAATMARMGVGLATFVLLARFLGPAQFGLIATAIAYATFIGIATDYGLGTYSLRSASGERNRTGVLVGDALATKAMLSVPVVVVCGIVFAIILPPFETLIYAIVFVGALAASFADLALVAARANQRFDIEAKLVVVASLVWMLVVGGVAALTHDVLASAIAFGITRAAYLLAVMIALRGWLGKPAAWSRPFADVRRTLASASTYAADTILTTLSSQIDILLFGLVLTKIDIGIYQAGARLVQVVAPFSVVLSTVYLPVMAAAIINHREKEFTKLSRQITIEFAVLALLGGAAFALLGPLITHILYGQRYEALQGLWGGFAVFVVFRFAAAGYGIQLVALGRIRPRLISNIMSIGSFVIATAIILPRYGLASTSWLLSGSSAVTFAFLSVALIRDPRHLPMAVWVAVLIPAAVVIFMFATLI